MDAFIFVIGITLVLALALLLIAAFYLSNPKSNSPSKARVSGDIDKIKEQILNEKV
jgi:hypothetical protein